MMFGGGGFPYSLPPCQQPIMYPYDVPVPQPCPYPVPVPQPCFQNYIQPVDVPIQNTIQPIIIPRPFCVPVPHPIPVPVECPRPVPVPQPIPVPVERPCPVPFPVCVPIPQPCAVPQPILVREQVCVPVPVQVPAPQPVPQPVPWIMPQQYYPPQYYCEEEYSCEEPIYVKRRRRHHHRRRRSCTPCPSPLPPIIIPIPIQGSSFGSEQPQMQVTEYVQDIYPPAQVFTDQVPVGYIANNSMFQEPGQIQNQQSLNCQPAMILPPSPCMSSSPQLVEQLPSGQFVERQLSVGRGGL